LLKSSLTGVDAMIDNNHYGPVIVTLLLLSIGIPLLSASNITGHATDIGGVTISTTTAVLAGILIICGLLLLFYGKSKITGSIERKKNFKLAYNPESDLDRLRAYIKSRVDSHETHSEIKHKLRKVGWDESKIEQAFNTLDQFKPIKPKKKFDLRNKLKKKDAKS